ncbi:eotaxin-like [Clupea harengus]|uniref:Eotaxin-like n=1 Tax=Clupea harengus TaxID=7950 RepID=A0A6P8GQC3_CLUHA|nr:eotaxin-like [Clupea harengus]
MRYMLVIAVVGALFLAVTALPHGRYRTPTKVTTTCCKNVSRARIRDIVDFKRHHAQPPCKEAIVFITKDAKKYCTDPNAPWAAKNERYDLKEIMALILRIISAGGNGRLFTLRRSKKAMNTNKLDKELS